MASDVDCKQNEATCNKKHNPKYKHSYTNSQSIRHILILLFSAAQGP